MANICLVSMFSICHAMCFANMMRQNIPVINWLVQSVNASILHSRVFPSVPFQLQSVFLLTYSGYTLCVLERGKKNEMN